MSYQVLARKYRPQSFEDIIGQAHVATTLKNALMQGKVAHAYLFSGPRGVGKTTAARVLAKALNCEKGPTPTPCNECDACRRIAQGQEMMDVLEIDAASNRGIEEIRELRENVRYAPAKSRYKVYIVDEAHQITHDAFNAFLKTLEEPPEHAVFILATTEMQKIPATILSRCQSFRFRRVSPENIASQLGKILAQEKIQVDEAALVRLAKAAGGSVRDALSLLDQALAYATGPLTLAQVETLLGFLPEEFLEGFAKALLSREPLQVLQWVQKLSEEGWELPQFIRDFREYLREQLTSQVGEGKKPEAMQIAGLGAPLRWFLQTLKVMGQCSDEMRWNDNPQLALELYALRLTQPLVEIDMLLKRIDQLEQQTPPARPLAWNNNAGEVKRRSTAEAVTRLPEAPAVRQQSGAAMPRLRDESNTGEAGLRDTGEAAVSFIKAPTLGPSDSRATSPAVSPSSRLTVPPSPVAPVPQSSNSSGDVASLWKQFISELWKKPAVASHMERARLKTATDQEWTVSFSDKFAMDSAQRSQPFIQETLDRLVGKRLMIRYVQEARSPDDEPSEVVVSPDAEKKMAEAGKDANVQKILQMFKGKIRLPEVE